jgi:hypothetical protein
MRHSSKLGVVLLLGVLVAGCAPWPAYDRYEHYDSYDNSSARLPPPPGRYESPGVPPGADHVWSGGYWIWLGSRYDWMPGRWEAPGHRYQRPPHRIEHHERHDGDRPEPPRPPRSPPGTSPPDRVRDPNPGTHVPVPPPPGSRPPNADDDKGRPGNPGRLYQIPRVDPPRPASGSVPDSPFRRMDADQDRHERQSNRPSGRSPGVQRMQVE